jgi:Fic family protein
MVRRIEGLWEATREAVVNIFPAPPGRPGDPAEYLRFVDDIYTTDAYHSLSIEGYSVTPELLARVRAGDWDPEGRHEDRDHRDALAARGYWQAFQLVKKSVEGVLRGDNAGALVRTAHREWYRELFQPFVAAGIHSPSALAGYRNDPVYLRGSRHVPPRGEAVRDAMPVLFDLLVAEGDPSARAVLGHWLIGYIHPYPDGNGRIARFLMNLMLASGGYPWTVIRMEDRDEYLSTLEAASVETDLGPFARFLAKRVRWSLDRVV